MPAKVINSINSLVFIFRKKCIFFFCTKKQAREEECYMVYEIFQFIIGRMTHSGWADMQRQNKGDKGRRRREVAVMWSLNINFALVFYCSACVYIFFLCRTLLCHRFLLKLRRIYSEILLSHARIQNKGRAIRRRTYLLIFICKNYF